MDELRRLRELAEDAPEPDPGRKAQARSELMQMAEEASAELTAQQPGWRERWSARLGDLRERLRQPVPAVGLAAAAALAVVGVGVLVTGPDPVPDAELADPDSTEPDSTEPDSIEVEPPEVELEPGVELAASCTGPDGRVTVDYPDEWFTPEAGEPGACRFFGEEPVDVDAAIGGEVLAAVEVVVEPTPFDEVAEPQLGVREQEREPFTEGDRRALRQRLEATGEAAFAEGMWIERFLLDLGGETLIISSYADDDATLDERQPQLEAMVRNVEIADER